jgi:hypothetical protein
VHDLRRRRQTSDIVPRPVQALKVIAEIRSSLRQDQRAGDALVFHDLARLETEQPD